MAARPGVMAAKGKEGSDVQERTPANKLVLTQQVIARSPSLPKPYRIWDTKQPGLYVRVQPSGVRVFYVAFARNQQMPLGRFPTVTVDQARTSARKALGEAAEHGAPLRVRQRREGRQRAAGERIVTLGELIEHRYAPWVTAERKAGAATLQALKAQFGTWYGRKFDELTPWALERFKADRLKSGTAAATVNRDVDRIKAVMSKAVEWGVIAVNPLANVKRVKGANDSRVRFLSDAESKRLSAALEKREGRRRRARERGNAWRVARDHEPRPEWGPDEYTDHLMPLVLLALNTGARRGELFGLTWADVDLQRGLMTVRAATSKGNRTRHIPLNADALAALKRWKGSPNREGLVFPGPLGTRMGNINKSWAELVKLAKLENFRFHDCRHDFASRLVMAGVDLNTVRELLGHSDIAMTLRYAHLAPEHKADAVAKLIRPKAGGSG